jgi:hypothetical protein
VRTAYLHQAIGETQSPNVDGPFTDRIDAAKASLLTAGFDGVEASDIRMTHEVADPEQFAIGHIRGTSVSNAFEAAGLDQGKAARDLAQLFRVELGSEPCKTQIQAIFMSPRKPNRNGPDQSIDPDRAHGHFIDFATRSSASRSRRKPSASAPSVRSGG